MRSPPCFRGTPEGDNRSICGRTLLQIITPEFTAGTFDHAGEPVDAILTDWQNNTPRNLATNRHARYRVDHANQAMVDMVWSSKNPLPTSYLTKKTGPALFLHSPNSPVPRGDQFFGISIESVCLGNELEIRTNVFSCRRFKFAAVFFEFFPKKVKLRGRSVG